jgi:iron(II)-dependent oxidoreductase
MIGHMPPLPAAALAPSPSLPDDPAALAAHVADLLDAARRRSRDLTDALDEAELRRQHSPLMSPLIWDLAHVPNYEELWLLREVAAQDPLRPEIDQIYDAFVTPRALRPTLPVLGQRETREYADGVRARVLDALAGPARPLPAAGQSDGRRARLLGSGFAYGLVLQHEHQHAETMLQTLQLRRGEPSLAADPEPPRPPAGQRLPEMVRVDAGPFVMGTSTDPWAYDNERPAHVVDLPAYEIDTVPVTNGAYLAFVESGGYDDRRLWSDAGWRWRCETGERAPLDWRREGGSWVRQRFGRVEPLPLDEPVQHVCRWEAEAYAASVGKRLPTEAEWEKAAAWDPVAGRARRYPWGDTEPGLEHANLGQRHLRPAPVGAYPAGASAYGVHQMLGDVWEWTSTEFDGYPGFATFPYREYSEVFFAGRASESSTVLRGGSWAVHPTAARATFRNWDFPQRRQVFAGFRCARSVPPARGAR